MIKNIILDFGDVFINLDKSATAREMLKYGYTTTTPNLDSLFKAYEKGIVSTEAFLEETGRLFPTASSQILRDAWNAILLDFPDTRLEFIEALAAEQNYRLFLLSNINELHIRWVEQSLGVQKMERFKRSFEVFYLSYEINMRKPDPEIFEFVLDENGLLPEETLFVDDTKENTDAAAVLGLATWNLKVGYEDITQLKSRL